MFDEGNKIQLQYKSLPEAGANSVVKLSDQPTDFITTIINITPSLKPPF